MICKIVHKLYISKLFGPNLKMGKNFLLQPTVGVGQNLRNKVAIGSKSMDSGIKDWYAMVMIYPIQNKVKTRNQSHPKPHWPIGLCSISTLFLFPEIHIFSENVQSEKVE